MKSLKITRPEAFSKQAITELIERINTQVEEGNAYPTEAFLFGKMLQEVGKAVCTKNEQATDIELGESKGGQDIPYENVKIMKVPPGETIQYGEDPVIKDLEDQIKKRKELVQAATKGMSVADENGEIVAPVSKKPRKGSIRISWK